MEEGGLISFQFIVLPVLCTVTCDIPKVTGACYKNMSFGFSEF